MTHRIRVASLSAALATLALSAQVSADTSTIKRPGAHPNYFFEAEPHLVVGFLDPPGHHGNDGFGPGFRGTFELVDNGFISKINNTVGIGVGMDWLFFNDHCHGNGNNRNCHDSSAILFPVVMQWNFWLSRNWSVFGEPGLMLVFEDHDDDNDFHFRPFVFYAGGRFHFSDAISLTMRAGWPTFSVGVSFFL
jgi:hypothetical protein